MWIVRSLQRADSLTENDMGRPCSTHGGDMYAVVRCELRKERDQWEDQDVGGRITLKSILEIYVRVVQAGLVSRRIWTSGPSGSINFGKFFSSWATGGFTRRCKLRGVSYLIIRVKELERERIKSLHLSWTRLHATHEMFRLGARLSDMDMFEVSEEWWR
jgi:hypothetical protein